jgi:hypothetical protein
MQLTHHVSTLPPIPGLSSPFPNLPQDFDTALDLACQSGNVDLVKMFLDRFPEKLQRKTVRMHVTTVPL